LHTDPRDCDMAASCTPIYGTVTWRHDATGEYYERVWLYYNCTRQRWCNLTICSEPPVVIATLLHCV